MTYPELVELIEAAPIATGACCRVVAIDGRSGAGKSFYAARVAAALGSTCISTDDLVPGWSGLAESIEMLRRDVLAPLVEGRAGRWRRFDWDRMEPGEWVEVPPAPLVVVEGCGVGVRRLSRLVSFLFWVEVSPEVQRWRLQARADWPAYEPYVDMWSEQERAVRAGDNVAARADVVIDNGFAAATVDVDRAVLCRPPAASRG
jgi:uridine kinase